MWLLLQVWHFRISNSLSLMLYVLAGWTCNDIIFCMWMWWHEQKPLEKHTHAGKRLVNAPWCLSKQSAARLETAWQPVFWLRAVIAPPTTGFHLPASLALLWLVTEGLFGFPSLLWKPWGGIYETVWRADWHIYSCVGGVGFRWKSAAPAAPSEFRFGLERAAVFQLSCVQQQ